MDAFERVSMLPVEDRDPVQCDLQLEEMALEIRQARRESRTLSLVADELEKELKKKCEEYRDLFWHDPPIGLCEDD